MRVIVAGSRTITDMGFVSKALMDSQFALTEIVSGGAKGVDWAGELWAKRNNVRLKVFNADWDRLGLRAGPVRNKQMAEYADALVAIWDGQSEGTKHMIKVAIKRQLKVYVMVVVDGTIISVTRGTPSLFNQ